MKYINTLQAFFFLLFLPLVHSKNHCPTSYCPNGSLPIQYPFRLQNQQTLNCNYTNLRCSNQGIAILDLPNNGDFYIRAIDYTHSLIKLYDPDNCLPKRLMSFNGSSLDYMYPFYWINYTFYSCPSELISLSNFTIVHCLSNSFTATVASHTVSGEVMKKLYRCNETVTSSIPVIGSPPDFIGNQTDFILAWFVPNCENCHHKATGLVSTDTLVAALYMMSLFTVTMPLLICIGCCAHFIRMLRKDAKANRSNGLRV